MFKTIAYLREGTAIQQETYKLLTKLGIFFDLASHQPLLCGTIPLGIHTSASDLDIIMCVKDFHSFQQKVEALYQNYEAYLFKTTEIRGIRTVKANFFVEGRELELFGQPQPSEKQYAYLHMCIQHEILTQTPQLKEQVIKLKLMGIKTEPAFAALLGLKGDPYEQLLLYGKKHFGIE